MSAVERAVEKIADAVERIAESTAKMAQLEIRHAETRDGLERAFGEISRLQEQVRGNEIRVHNLEVGKVIDAEKRIKAIEIDMPALKETRGWVVRAVIGIVALVGAALLALVIMK